MLPPAKDGSAAMGPLDRRTFLLFFKHALIPYKQRNLPLQKRED